MPTARISRRSMGFMWVSEVSENDANIIKCVSLQKQFHLTKSNGRF